MNPLDPRWLSALAGLFGMLVNTVWTILNLQMRADVAKQINELKDWMAREYVPHEMCALRHGLQGPREKGDSA